jgi:hypothetical protein
MRRRTNPAVGMGIVIIIVELSALLLDLPHVGTFD